jgi:hypothetical protein
VRGVGGHFGRVRRFQGSVIVVLPAVSVNGDAVGSRRSMPATRTIARTRHGHSVRGRKAIANTGASIGARTRNTARAIGPLPGSGSAIAGGMRFRRALRSLQRWTGRCRIHQCLQGFIGSSRQPLRSLQRWMRGWWKSLWYQRHTGKPRKFAKRGRDRGAAATLLGLRAWTRHGWILICIAWSSSFAGARLVEPRAVERIARSIEQGGQIVPCIAVADPPVKAQEGGERLVLIDGYRRVAALRRLAATPRGSSAGPVI